MENNVALEVIDKIKSDLKDALVDVPIPRGKINDKVADSLKKAIESLFEERFDIIEKIKQKGERSDGAIHNLSGFSEKA